MSVHRFLCQPTENTHPVVITIWFYFHAAGTMKGSNMVAQEITSPKKPSYISLLGLHKFSDQPEMLQKAATEF